jgi:DNA topoisomerase-1
MTPRTLGTYKLVIAEKPDASRRIAGSLGQMIPIRIQGVEVLDVPLSFDQNHYVVCSAAGHLYGLADPSGIRRVYPIFDVLWIPSEELLLSKKNTKLSRSFRRDYSRVANNVTKRLDVISELAYKADQIIHACDYDIEGETIGYNIIRFACRNSRTSKPVLRAKFSTLTEHEIRDSFSKMTEIDLSMADAGTTRHLVDYVWGINLSRALSEAHRSVEGKFRNITIGRVQGPTLAFVVDREIELMTYVPVPYWTISATLLKDAINFDATYEKEKIEIKSEADTIYAQIKQETTAQVLKVEEHMFSEHPPYPFNLGDLQKEAFRLYKFSPSMTVSIAEKLYLRALISYPRTSSQKLPPSIGYSGIINKLLSQKEYSKFHFQMQEGKRRLFPIQGGKDDPAHPAIYPTGISPGFGLSASEKKIYNLVVLRFLACFAEDARVKQTSVMILISDYRFVANGQFLLVEGWKSIYPFRHLSDSQTLSNLTEGEKIKIVESRLESKLTKPHPRYNQSSLLTRMESQNIGTKATRAETISTLLDRAYVLQDNTGFLAPTETGLSLIETLETKCPAIISTELTRRTDESLERIIGKRENAPAVLAKAFRDVVGILELVRGSKEEIGALLRGAGPEGDDHHRSSSLNKFARRRPAYREVLIGKCPTCRTGNLKIIRSQKTRKRFVGCTNYSSGCNTSAPLPQRGIISRYSQRCNSCGWPMISVGFAPRIKRTWNVCLNPSCPSKQVTKKEGS